MPGFIKPGFIKPGFIKPGFIKPAPNDNGVSGRSEHTFFRQLDELREGDEVDLRRQGELYGFEVTGRRVVEPTDLSALQNSGSAQLTLITCYPTHYLGPPKRLVVVARWIATLRTTDD
jgi:sortase A